MMPMDGPSAERHQPDERPKPANQAAVVVGRTLAQNLIESLGARVQRIILFGSRARGDATAESDYDLLVVLRDLSTEERHGMLLAMYRAVEGADVVAEIHVMNEEEFEETKGVIGGLAYPASKEGVLLYENPRLGGVPGWPPA